MVVEPWNLFNLLCCFCILFEGLVGYVHARLYRSSRETMEASTLTIERSAKSTGSIAASLVSSATHVALAAWGSVVLKCGLYIAYSSRNLCIILVRTNSLAGSCCHTRCFRPLCSSLRNGLISLSRFKNYPSMQTSYVMQLSCMMRNGLTFAVVNLPFNFLKLTNYYLLFGDTYRQQLLSLQVYLIIVAD